MGKKIIKKKQSLFERIFKAKRASPSGLCSDPRTSDTDFGGFTMSKLTKKDKLNIYKEWTIEN
ncbi:hypothetical protein ACTVOG_08070, partial [Lactobacillus gasseri]